MVASVVVLALAAGCTSAGDDAGDTQDTEVGGAVLERDEDGEPVAADDPDEDRVDPRDDPDDVQADDDAADDADEADEAEDDRASDAGSEGSAGEASEPEPAEADEPAEATDPGPAEANRPPSSGSPPSDPTPAQPARPTPQALAAGPGLDGDLVGFGEDGAEVLIGAPIESPPPVGVRSDAVRPSAADEVRCETALQAPQDRGLIARGELAVALLLSEHDGTQRRVALQLVDLDVELVAGERFELPATRVRAVDREVVGSVACEAVFAPS